MGKTLQKLMGKPFPIIIRSMKVSLHTSFILAFLKKTQMRVGKAEWSQILRVLKQLIKTVFLDTSKIIPISLVTFLKQPKLKKRKIMATQTRFDFCQEVILSGLYAPYSSRRNQ